MTSAPDCLTASATAVKSCEKFGYPWISTGSMPMPFNDATKSFMPLVPKASVECTIAHFFLPSVLVP